MAAVCLIAGMSAEQRSLRDRPRNRPDNEQRGNGPHFQLSEIVVFLILFASGIILITFTTRAILFAKAFPIEIHIITLLFTLIVLISAYVWIKKVPDIRKREAQGYRLFKVTGVVLAILMVGQICLMLLMIILGATGHI